MTVRKSSALNNHCLSIENDGLHNSERVPRTIKFIAELICFGASLIIETRDRTNSITSSASEPARSTFDLNSLKQGP